MSVRFDEIELLKEPELPSPQPTAEIPAEPPTAARLSAPRAQLLKKPIRRDDTASLFHRALAFLTDFSLFLALALALSPLLTFHGDWQLTLREEWPTLLGLGGFLFVLSYYYFVVGWLIWGRTVGGAIFDVRIVSSDSSPMTVRRATRRWTAMLLSLTSAGVGFFMVLFPGRRSFADRFSGTRAVAA